MAKQRGERRDDEAQVTLSGDVPDVESEVDVERPMTTDDVPDLRDPMSRVDPITNQPMSDFMLSLDDDHPDAEAVRLQQSQIRVGSGVGRLAAAQALVETRARERAQAEQAEADREAIEKANPLPEREITMLPPDLYRARERARVLAEANALGTNRSRPGGRFKVNGVWVNANGDKLEDQSE
jgi:hypothetical protein